MVQEIRDYLHEQADAGAYRTTILARHLQSATDEVWDELTASVEGPGRVQAQHTIAVGDPDGYVPGRQVPMPARWRRLVVVRRNGQPLAPGDPARDDLVAGRTGRYWVDGPNQITTGGVLAVSSAVLLTSDAWVAGDELDWVYIDQAPLWVDPSDATIDVEVDLATAEIARAMSHVAGALAVARGDAQGLARARGEMDEAIKRFKTRSRDLHTRPRRLADYQRGRR